MAHRSVLLLLSSPEDEALWRSLLASQQVHTGTLLHAGARLIDALAADPRMPRTAALLVDLPILAGQRLTLPAFTSWVRSRWPGLKVIVRLPWRVRISVPEEAWAVTHGATALVAGQSVRALRETILPALRKLAHALDIPAVDAAAAENFLRVLSTRSENAHSASIGGAVVALERLARVGLRPDAICAEMMAYGGVVTKDRGYRGRTYRQCFVGAEAFAWLREQRRLDAKTAALVGEVLGTLGLVHHVAREHELADAGYFYRFGGPAAILDALDLGSVARELRETSGVRIMDRTYLGKTYPRCLIGSEAVDWLAARHRLMVGEAEAIGQRLVDLGLLHHVVDAHGFVDSPYFYRFTSDDAS